MSILIYWTLCLYPEKKGFLAGTKIQLSQCIECEFSECKMKSSLFKTYFLEYNFPEETPLNKKLMALNYKLSKKAGQSRLYCPKKSEPTTNCTGYTKFCKYNLICGKITKREGLNFIKSLRWRKAMIYVVKFIDGTIKVIEKNDFGSVNIDSVEIVYPGNLEVQVVTELVPLGEENEKMSETIQTFKEKYAGEVVTKDGLIDFQEWFKNAKSGDSAVIPEHALVPQKSYRVVKIKTEDKKSAKKETEKNLQPNIFDITTEEKEIEKETEINSKSKKNQKK